MREHTTRIADLRQTTPKYGRRRRRRRRRSSGVRGRGGGASTGIVTAAAVASRGFVHCEVAVDLSGHW